MRPSCSVSHFTLSLSLSQGPNLSKNFDRERPPGSISTLTEEQAFVLTQFSEGGLEPHLVTSLDTLEFGAPNFPLSAV